MRVEKEKDCFCFTNLISGNEKLKKIMGFKLAVFIYLLLLLYELRLFRVFNTLKVHYNDWYTNYLSIQKFFFYMKFDYLGFLIL